MTEATNDLDQDDLPQVDELTLLKQRATTLGLKYHPSISVDKLKEKVTAALNNITVDEVLEPTVEVKTNKPKTRAEMAKEAMKLVRIRLTCMNPAKKEWNGELFTAGNSLVKTVTKYVPFNNEEGWHVPQIILNVIKDRQCQIFVTEKRPNGDIRKGKTIKEFAVEILPSLTEEELKDLAQRQAMAKSIG